MNPSRGAGLEERRGRSGPWLAAGLIVVAAGVGLLEWAWEWGWGGVGALVMVMMVGAWWAGWALGASGGGGAGRELVRELRRVRIELGQVRLERDALLRSIHGGVLTLDSQQRIVRLDRAAEALLGASEAHSRGRLVQEVTRQPELNRFVEESVARGGTHEAEIVIRPEETRLAGSGDAARVRRVRAIGSPLGEGGEGAALGLLIVLIDMTEIRRLETLRSDFAANVSHELRTPITNIKGYVETLLESGFDDRAQATEFLKTVARHADRLGTIIEDLLTLTRLERAEEESEAIETRPERVDRIVSEVEAELEGQLRAKSITLVRDIPSELGASMNEALMRLALANLVGNAIRYSPPGRRVWVRAKSAEQRGSGGGGVVISVEDEGPGIEPEHRARLFERFYRVDKARSRDAGGTGLGLAIVKHIAQLHGGTVEVASAVGGGSVFSLTLPTKQGEMTRPGALHARP